MKFIYSILFALLFSATISAQGPTKIQALNNYVSFINESIHGMVIVHRLLENYNQELNKYVDLGGYQINNFGNKDLPRNIFQDPENWFYDISPLEWYIIAKDASSLFPQDEAYELNFFMDGLRQKINRINEIRFDLEDFINTNDLTNKTNIEKVYSFLEEGTALYDSFYELQLKFEVLLIKLARKYQNPEAEMMDIVEVFDKNWFAAKNILRSVRNKKDESISGQVYALSASLNKMKNIDIGGHDIAQLKSRENIQAWNQSIKKLEKIIENALALIETAVVPKEYKLYGKFYYYHNAVLANQLNRYGSGFVNEMNDIIKNVDIPILFRTEEPHFYQIIYPKKLVNEEIIASSDDNISKIPTKLKDREIIKSSRIIKVDTTIFEINLFDYKIQDGDIVSINFNGDWILENHSLEGKPTKLKVKMNEEGKNYLLLHAENEGRNPPNTMAITYKYKGETQKITLSSNLNESEMIEILYDPQ